MCMLNIWEYLIFCNYISGWADKISGSTFKLNGPFHGISLYEPIGVTGAIIPWNFPMIMFMVKAAPALAAGNTLIIKPAEQTPFTALYLAALAKKVCVCFTLHFPVFKWCWVQKKVSSFTEGGAH